MDYKIHCKEAFQKQYNVQKGSIVKDGICYISIIDWYVYICVVSASGNKHRYCMVTEK